MFKKIFLGLVLSGALITTPFAFAAFNGLLQSAPCTCCGEACECDVCACDANDCACDTAGDCFCTPACSSTCCDN